MDTISRTTIEKHAGRIGSHWFEPDTMRFFRSRVASVAYRTADGARAYFVSSEQPPQGTRRYSVRCADFRAKDCGRFIETFGDFLAYGSRGSADRAARRACEDYDREHRA